MLEFYPAQLWSPAKRCRISIVVRTGSVIRGGSRRRGAGSEIRWDPANLTPAKMTYLCRVGRKMLFSSVCSYSNREGWLSATAVLYMCSIQCRNNGVGNTSWTRKCSRVSLLQTVTPSENPDAVRLVGQPLDACRPLHCEAEKRNRFSFMNKSCNTQCNLTKFSTLI